jgi:DNA-binding MarR family transcriptional regulator
MARKTNANPQEPDRMEIADRIHSAAIHVLRAIRRSDVESGMSAARLSLLSVLVFRGSTSMGELAEAEQVSLPTISRMVASLEHAGFVVREKSAGDQRVVYLTATRAGTEVLKQARVRRIQELARRLEQAGLEDLEALRRAADLLERLVSGDDGAKRE